MADIIIDIGTRSRPRVLGRCLAALLAQTFQDWDVLIIDDSYDSQPVQEEEATNIFMERIAIHHQIHTIRGPKLGPAHNHNVALWESPWRDYRYILRMDDDVLLSNRAIELLYAYIEDKPDVVGVAGLWFENEHNEEWYDDRDVPDAEDWLTNKDLMGKVFNGLAGNWNQRVYHFKRKDYPSSQRVEHLYSVCLYRPQAMRMAGGWPTLFSEVINHGEETDGTYRLSKMGKLIILPQVTAQHLKSPGGIRSMGSQMTAELQAKDTPLNASRLAAMPGVYDRPLKVGVWGQQAAMMGDSTAYFYNILDALSQRDFRAYPVGDNVPPDIATEHYGITPQLPIECHPTEVDVLINIGQDITFFERASIIGAPIAPANLFAVTGVSGKVRPSDKYQEVSAPCKTIAEEVVGKWLITPRRILPLAHDYRCNTEKQDSILVIGRVEANWGINWLMEQFLASDLPRRGIPLHIAAFSDNITHIGYLRQLQATALANENIRLHLNPTQAQMMELCQTCKVVWSAAGMLNPESADIYGTTVLEAMGGGCVPLTYDAGAYKEFVPQVWRWTDADGLLSKTAGILFGRDALPTIDLQPYSEEVFRDNWLSEIKRVAPDAKTIGIWCQHPHGIGGAQRLFYTMLCSLQGADCLKVWAVNDEADTHEQVETNFGIPCSSWLDEDAPEEYDLIIVIGHDLVDRSEVGASSKKCIAYILFPDISSPFFDQYESIVAISKFTASHIKARWKSEASVIYPVVRPFEITQPKENIILLPGRLDPNKAIYELAEAFVRMELENWRLVIVSGTTFGIFKEYEEKVTKFVAHHPNIELKLDVEQSELEELYSKARIVWTGRGLLTGNKPKEQEHFGYVPVEAMSAGCYPLAFDAAGHRETTPPEYLWTDLDDLIAKTRKIAAICQDIAVDKKYFDRERFANQWEQLVYQANAQAVQLHSQDRQAYLEVRGSELTIGVVSDSPQLRSGFGVVINQIIPGFVEAGMKVHVLGMMSGEPPKEQLPYTLWPCYPQLDPMGERIFPQFMNTVDPDVLFMLYDPGTLHGRLVIGSFSFSLRSRKRGGGDVPTVVYFPVEGKPLSTSYGEMMRKVQQTGGKVITYCKSGADAIKEQFPFVQPIVAYHGHDHADFRPYTPTQRQHLRKLAGLDDYFVIGYGGTNKRTKEHPILIYAARCLKDMGESQGTRIYLHTDPDEPILQGYHLRPLSQYWDVEDIMLFRPDTSKKRGGIYQGVAYNTMTLEQCEKLSIPTTKEERGALFGNYDLISRYNCMDLYVDVSSVEGWGLYNGEAMRCGVPVLTVDDGMVRSEVLKGGVEYMPPAYWSTWHTGARLAQLDPKRVANRIVYYRDNPAARQKLADKGREVADKYKWADCRKIIVKAVLETAFGR